MRPDPGDGGLRRYLLGLLPETEAEALEDAYLADPEVWARLRGIEDDLLDDYVAGRLGPGEAEALEARYLTSPALRDRVAAARALRLAASPRGTAAAQVSRMRSARWPVRLPVAAGLVLAVLAFWASPSRAPEVASVSAPPTSAARPATTRPATPEPGPTESARREPPPSARDPGARTVVLALAPVLLRGQLGSAELSVPPGTRAVVLELEGDPALVADSATGLEAVLKTVEGRSVWRGPARRAGGDARPSLLASARVPASRLLPGDYLLELSQRGTEAAAVHTYFLRIGR